MVLFAHIWGNDWICYHIFLQRVQGLAMIKSKTQLINMHSLFPKLTAYEFILFLYVNRIMINTASKYAFGEAFASHANLIINGIIALYTLFLIIEEAMPLDILIVLCLYLLQVFVTVTITPSLTDIASDAMRRFAQCYFGYCLFSRIKDSSSITHILPYTMVALIVYSYLMLRVANIDHSNNAEYFPVSYGIVLQATLMLLYTRMIPLYGPVGILATLVILFAGARGAFICVVAAVALSLITTVSVSRSILSKFLWSGLIAGVFIILAVNFDSLVDAIHTMMPDSRTMRLFVSETTIDNSRLTIWQQITNELINHPFIYRGVLSDRLVGGVVYGMTPHSGTYAHNLFLEFFYQNGLLIGIPIMLLFLYKTTKAIQYLYSSSQMKSERLLFIALFSCSIVQLMYSNSYLINWIFWCLIGFVRHILVLKHNSIDASDAS